jgi:hypothetical protein
MLPHRVENPSGQNSIKAWFKEARLAPDLLNFKTRTTALKFNNYPEILLSTKKGKEKVNSSTP